MAYASLPIYCTEGTPKWKVWEDSRELILPSNPRVNHPGCKNPADLLKNSRDLESWEIGNNQIPDSQIPPPLYLSPSNAGFLWRSLFAFSKPAIVRKGFLQRGRRVCLGKSVHESFSTKQVNPSAPVVWLKLEFHLCVR